MNYLDFDNVITQPVSFYQGNYYDKTFHQPQGIGVTALLFLQQI